METKLRIEGNWDELKSKLKQKFEKLTDKDLTFEKGKENELLVCLEKRLGMKKEAIISEIQKLQLKKDKSKVLNTMDN